MCLIIRGIFIIGRLAESCRSDGDGCLCPSDTGRHLSSVDDAINLPCMHTSGTDLVNVANTSFSGICHTLSGADISLSVSVLTILEAFIQRYC